MSSINSNPIVSQLKSQVQASVGDEGAPRSGVSVQAVAEPRPSEGFVLQAKDAIENRAPLANRGPAPQIFEELKTFEEVKSGFVNQQANAIEDRAPQVNTGPTPQVLEELKTVENAKIAQRRIPCFE